MSCGKSCNIIPNIRTLIEEHYEFFGVFFTFTHHLYSFVYHLFFPFQWMNFYFSPFIAEVKTFLLLLISENAYFVSLNHSWSHLPKRWSNKNDLYKELIWWHCRSHIYVYTSMLVYNYSFILFSINANMNIYNLKQHDNHQTSGEIHCFTPNCHIQTRVVIS